MKKIILAILVLLVAGTIGIAALAYIEYLIPIVDENSTFIIRKNQNSDQIGESLYNEGIIPHTWSFELLATAIKYEDKISPGKFRITQGMNLLEVIRLLRSGNVTTENISFHNVRTLDDLAGKLSRNVMADSANLYRILISDSIWNHHQLSKQEAFCNLIPNTYEVYWNSTAAALVDRLIEEHKKFWSQNGRKEQAQALGLSTCEISVLASIVQEEQKIVTSEHKTIAGLYLNRIKIGMKLQADPTLKYAARDFSIKQVLDIHKLIDSPYNTYMYEGLPPTPISLPEPEVIDAVLNHESHDYIYMCAKADFSGYHNFSTNYEQHQRYAAQYQRALKQEIKNRILQGK